MGYLSQKKRQTRENIFFWTTAVILALFTARNFADAKDYAGFFNLFHLYCLSGVLMFGALWRRKYRAVLFFGLLLLINFTVLSSSTNIFLSDDFNGKQALTFAFVPEGKPLLGSADANVISAGSVIINHHYTAPYVVLNYTTPITLVMVDFRQAQDDEYPIIFGNLRDFMLTQDNPVIIFGEFGIPSWNKSFKQFMKISGLSVKNRLLFTKNSPYNIFSTPSFYVLGFKEMGISDICIEEKDGKKIVRINGSFNPDNS